MRRCATRYVLHIYNRTSMTSDGEEGPWVWVSKEKQPEGRPTVLQNNLKIQREMRTRPYIPSSRCRTAVNDESQILGYFLSAGFLGIQPYFNPAW